MTLKHRLARLERRTGVRDVVHLSDDDISFNDGEAYRLKKAVGLLILHNIEAAGCGSQFLSLNRDAKAHAFAWMIQNDPEVAEARQRYQGRLALIRNTPSLMATIQRRARSR